MKLSLVAERERERDYSFVPHSLIYYEPHGFSSIKVWIQKKHQSFSTLMLHSAEREGFEPPVRCRTIVFKTTAFDHSAISPIRVIICSDNGCKCKSKKVFYQIKNAARANIYLNALIIRLRIFKKDLSVQIQLIQHIQGVFNSFENLAAILIYGFWATR